MQTNMSPLTDLGMHDQFSEPQLNSAGQVKKLTLPQNTVSMHTVVFCSNIVKQNQLEKQNFKKREWQIQMFSHRCHVDLSRL